MMGVQSIAHSIYVYIYIEKTKYDLRFFSHELPEYAIKNCHAKPLFKLNTLMAA